MFDFEIKNLDQARVIVKSIELSFQHEQKFTKKEIDELEKMYDSLLSLRKTKQ